MCGAAGGGVPEAAGEGGRGQARGGHGPHGRHHGHWCACPPPSTPLTHHACLCGAARKLAWVYVWATKTSLLSAILSAMSSALSVVEKTTDVHSTGHCIGAEAVLSGRAVLRALAALRAQVCWTRAGAM